MVSYYGVLGCSYVVARVFYVVAMMSWVVAIELWVDAQISKQLVNTINLSERHHVVT